MSPDTADVEVVWKDNADMDQVQLIKGLTRQTG
jgi:hypothetical protein